MSDQLHRWLEEKGIDRREFMEYAGLITTTLGLSSLATPRVAEVMAHPKQRPSVVWLHNAECTGCTESFIRSTYPWVREIVLDVGSLDYHETVMAAAGYQAEEILQKTSRKKRASISVSVRARSRPRTMVSMAGSAEGPCWRSTRRLPPMLWLRSALGAVPASAGFRPLNRIPPGQNP